MSKENNENDENFVKVIIYIVLGIVIAIGLGYLYLALTK